MPSYLMLAKANRHVCLSACLSVCHGWQMAHRSITLYIYRLKEFVVSPGNSLPHARLSTQCHGVRVWREGGRMREGWSWGVWCRRTHTHLENSLSGTSWQMFMVTGMCRHAQLVNTQKVGFRGWGAPARGSANFKCKQRQQFSVWIIISVYDFFSVYDQWTLE